MESKGKKKSTIPDDATIPGIDENQAVDLVMELMAIPGKSCEEGEIAAAVQKKLKAAGIPDSAVTFDTAHRKSPTGGEVGNLIVKLPGTIRTSRRLLMAHLDTVPLCVGSRPERKGKEIRSRDPHIALGADNRAGVGVVLTAIREIQRQKLPHPPLTLFWPVQEEIGIKGVRWASLSKLGKPRLCFNWDGRPPNNVCLGATGDYAVNIEVEGIASHAGVHPEEGVSAIAIAGMAIADLVENGWHGLVIRGKRTGTSNIGFISGGEATNVVTPHAKLRAEVRSHDPRFRKKILEEFRRAFQKAARNLKNQAGKKGKVRFDSDLKYESFRLSEDEPVVQAARSAIEATGRRPEMGITNGGLDANWMNARGLPTVTLGCGQQNVHTVNETLNVEEYLAACRIGLLLARGGAS